MPKALKPLNFERVGLPAALAAVKDAMGFKRNDLMSIGKGARRRAWPSIKEAATVIALTETAPTITVSSWERSNFTHAGDRRLWAFP